MASFVFQGVSGADYTFLQLPLVPVALLPKQAAAGTRATVGHVGAPSPGRIIYSEEKVSNCFRAPHRVRLGDLTGTQPTIQDCEGGSRCDSGRVDGLG